MFFARRPASTSITNVLAFVLAAALTVVMTLISGIVPTLRAARVDPVVELRS